MNECIFVLSNLSLLYICFNIVNFFLKDAQKELQSLVLLALYPVLALLWVIVFGLIGAISPLTMNLSAVPLALAMAIWNFSLSRKNTTISMPASRNSLMLPFLFAGLSFAATIAAARVLPYGKVFSEDDLCYHATAVAHWVQNGSLTPTPMNYHAYFPFNAETFDLWLLAPFHNDSLAQFVGLFWHGILIFSIFVICRNIKISHLVSFIVVAAIACWHIVFSVSFTFAAVDLAAPAMICATLAIITSDIGRRPAACFFAGLMAGYALGCKVTFVVPIAAIITWIFFYCYRKRSLRSIAALICLFGTGVAITGSFWYIRNLVLTGNPVFPGEAGPFAGPLTKEILRRSSLAYWLGQAGNDPRLLFDIILQHLSFPITLFAGLGFFFIAAIIRRQKNPGSKAYIWLLWMVGIAVAVYYPFSPFSGSNNTSVPPLRIDLRFVILPLSLGTILLGTLIDNIKYRKLFAAISIIILLIPTSTVFWWTLSTTLLVGLAIVVLLWNSDKFGFVKKVAVPRNIILIAIGILMAASVSANHMHEALKSQLYSWGGTERPIGKLCEQIDLLPEDSSIVFFSKGAYQYYLMMGRQWQHKDILRRGWKYEPLHEQWKRDPSSCKWWSRKKNIRKNDTMIDILLDNNVEYVAISKWGRNQWPAILEYIKDSPAFESIYDDEYSMIFVNKAEKDR